MGVSCKCCCCSLWRCCSCHRQAKAAVARCMLQTRIIKFSCSFADNPAVAGVETNESCSASSAGQQIEWRRGAPGDEHKYDGFAEDDVGAGAARVAAALTALTALVALPIPVPTRSQSQSRAQTDAYVSRGGSAWLWCWPRFAAYYLQCVLCSLQREERRGGHPTEYSARSACKFQFDQAKRASERGLKPT